MPENQPRRTRRAKSSPSQTLFSILNPGMMKHQWPNWKSASVQSLWTDFFGVLENSLLLGKYYILSWSIGAVVIFWYKEQSATLFFSDTVSRNSRSLVLLRMTRLWWTISRTKLSDLRIMFNQWTLSPSTKSKLVSAILYYTYYWYYTNTKLICH